MAEPPPPAVDEAAREIRHALRSFDDEYSAISLSGRTLSEYAKEWVVVGVDPAGIEEWMLVGLWEASEVAPWAAARVNPVAAEHCIRSGITVEQFLSGTVILDDLDDYDLGGDPSDALSEEGRRTLEVLVHQVLRSLDDLHTQIDLERFAEIDLLVKILQLQLESPRPRRSIVRAVVNTLAAVATGVVSNVVYAKLMGHL